MTDEQRDRLELDDSTPRVVIFTMMKIIFPFLFMALLFSCQRQELVDEPWLPLDTRADYLRAIEQLNLAETYIGAQWIAAGEAALRDPTDVEAPLEEVFVLEADRPSAVGYRFPARRGRRITIEIDGEIDDFFADVYRVEADSPDPVPVASMPEGERTIVFEPRRDNYYILRIQPELLRGGRLTVRFSARAALTFPVEGVGAEAILSFYGDNRDGGARYHEGIDIFAPRGTPLLAASDGVVFRVGWRDRGGNIVSLRDDQRDLLLYYAHLDEQLVEEGQRVSAGDVIGTVGNTGNAIFTPPHLHIGVYQGGWRGSVDPWEFFVDPPVVDPVAPPQEKMELLGGWFVLEESLSVDRAVPPPEMAVRVMNRNPFLNLGPSVRTETGLHQIPPPLPREEVIPAGTAVQIAGLTGTRMRVRTPSGEEWITESAVLEVLSPLPGG